MDRLSDDNRKLRTELEVVKQRLDAAMQEREIASLDKRRLENEKALMRAECDELIATERRKAESARQETSGMKDHDNDRARRLQEELDRLSRQLNTISAESDRRVNDMEVTNTRLQGQVTTLTKEMKNKEQELASCQKDGQFQKENLERVIKELVEKNKRIEEDAKRRNNKSEADLSEILRQHEGTVQDLLEARRNLQAFKEEKNVYEAQLANSKAVNQDLLDEIETLKRKTREAEHAHDEARRDLDSARDREDDLRADVDELLGKLTRADSHIQRMTEEAAAANVAMMKLRHQSEILDEDLAINRRANDELLQRLVPMVRSACDETDRLMSGLEGAMRDLGGLVAAGVPGADVSGLLQERPDSRRSCWPAAGERDDEEASESGKLLLASVRLRDSLQTATEDCAWLTRGLVEERTKKLDRMATDEMRENTVKAERAHVMELAAKLNDVERLLKDTEEQKRAAEQSLLESSQWMSEAVALGEERAKNVENLLNDKRRLESTVEQQERDIDHLRSLVRKSENEVDALKSDIAKCEREVKSYMHAQQMADEDSAKARSVAQTLKLELEEKDRQLVRFKNNESSFAEVENRLDADVQYLKKQVTDMQRKLKAKDEHIAKLESIQSQQRDQLFDSERKLESALRRPSMLTGTPTAHSTSALDSTLGSPLATTDRSAIRPQSSAISPATGGHTLRSSAHYTSTPDRRSALVVSPSRQNRGTPDLPPSAVTGSSRHRSPVRSNQSALGTQAPGLTSASAASIQDSERASTDRLKAWEQRINSLLAQPSRDN